MSTEFINLENAHVYSKSPVSPGGLTTQAVNKSVHTIQANEVWAEEIPFIPTFNSETIAEQIEGHPVSVHTNKLTLLTSANNNGIGANGYAARVFIDGKPVEQYISETDKISEDGKLSNGYKPVVFLENGDLMPSSDYIVNCSSGIVYFFKEVTSNNYSLRYFTYDGKKLSDINGSLNDSFEEIKTNIEKNTTKINEVEEGLNTANDEIDNIHSDIEEINSAVENIDSTINSINNEIINNKIIINDIIISDDVTTPALQIEATKSEETPSPTTYTFTTNVYNKDEVDNKIAAVENTFTVSDSIDTDLTTPIGITSNGSRDYTLTYNAYTTSEVDTKLQNKVDEISINEDETVISIVLDETSNNKKYVVSSDTYNKSVIDEKIELGKTTIKIADEINTNIETPIGISSAVTDSGSTEYTINYNTYNTSEIDSKVNSKIGDIIVDDECPTLTITSETVDNNKIYTINSNAYTPETVDNKIAETKNEIIDIINDKVIVVERASDDNSADDVLTITNTLNEGSSDIYTIRVNAYNKAQTEEKINASLTGINSIIGERSEEEFRPSSNPDNSIWQTIDNLHDKFNDRLAGLLNSTVSNIAGDSFINIDKDIDTNTHEISLRTASSIDFEQNPGTTVPTTAAVKAAIDAVKNNVGSGDGNPVISAINLVGDSFVNTNKNEYGDTWQVSLNVSSDITSEENPQTTIPTVEATKNIIESTKENINNSINSVEQTFSDNLANHASSNTHINSTERTKWDSYDGIISGINDSLNDHIDNNDIHVSSNDKLRWNEAEELLNEHVTDGDKHITKEEREKWNSLFENKVEALPSVYTGNNEVYINCYGFEYTDPSENIIFDKIEIKFAKNLDTLTKLTIEGAPEISAGEVENNIYKITVAKVKTPTDAEIEIATSDYNTNISNEVDLSQFKFSKNIILEKGWNYRFYFYDKDDNLFAAPVIVNTLPIGDSLLPKNSVANRWLSERYDYWGAYNFKSTGLGVAANGLAVKLINSVQEHINNQDKHISSEERERWNKGGSDIQGISPGDYIDISETNTISVTNVTSNIAESEDSSLTTAASVREYVKDINDHITNNDIHISAADREKLNNFENLNSDFSTLTDAIDNHKADTTIHYQKFNTITETENAAVSSKAIYDALKAVKVEENISYETVWDKITRGSEKANAGGFYFTLDEDISCNTIEIYNIVKSSDTAFEEAHIKIWDENTKSLVASSIEKTTLSGGSSDIWLLPTTELMANTVYIVTFNDNNISTSLEAGHQVRFESLDNTDNKPAGWGLVKIEDPKLILYNHVAPKVVFKNKVQETTTTTIIPNSLYGEFLDHTENKDIHVSSEDKAKWDAASTNGNTALAAAAKNQSLIFSLDEDIRLVKQNITSLTTDVGEVTKDTAELTKNYTDLLNTINRYHPQTAEAGSISEDTVLSVDNESIILNDTVNAIFNLNDNDNIAIVSYTPHITGDIDLSTVISNNQIIFTLSKKETTINGEHYLVLELLYIDKNLKQVKRVYSYITIIVE